MLSNYGAGEDAWVSLGLQGHRTSQSYRKPMLNIHERADADTEAQYFGHLMQRADS